MPKPLLTRSLGRCAPVRRPPFAARAEGGYHHLVSRRQAPILAALLLTLATVYRLKAQEEEGRPLASWTLEQLLGALGAEDFPRRAAASSEIERRGPPIAEELRRARETLPLEARLRVDEILERIAHARRLLPGDFSATRITLALEDLPLDDVLRALGATAGSHIRRAVPTSGDQELVSFRVEDLPFLQALDQLCRQENLLRYRDYASGDILVNPSPTRVPEPPVAYAGPLRVALVNYSINRQLRFDGTRQTSSHIQIQVEIEDRAPFIGLLGPILATRAEDDRGGNLLPDAATPNPHVLRAGSNRQFNTSLALQPPSEGASRLVAVEVPLRILVPSEVAEASLLHPPMETTSNAVPTPSPGSGESAPGIDLRLEAVNEIGENRAITISFVAPPLETPPPAGSQMAWEEILVYDGQGERMRPTGIQSRRDPDGRQRRTLTLPAVPIAEIQVRCLTDFRTETVTALFTDVEVP